MAAKKRTTKKKTTKKRNPSAKRSSSSSSSSTRRRAPAKKAPSKRRKPRKRNPKMHPALSSLLGAVGGGGVTGGASATLRHFNVGSETVRGVAMLAGGLVIAPLGGLVHPAVGASLGGGLIALGTDTLAGALIGGGDNAQTEGAWPYSQQSGRPMTQEDLQAVARAQPPALNAVTYDNMAAVGGVTYDNMGATQRAQPADLLGAVIDPETGIMYDSKGRPLHAA